MLRRYSHEDLHDMCGFGAGGRDLESLLWRDRYDVARLQRGLVAVGGDVRSGDGDNY